MAPIKISFNDHNVTPPVYVSGSFTEWQPIELPSTGGPGEYTHEKTFDLAPGSYHYKFRLGSGDWWVCDHETATARDDAGNENNVLVVEPEQIKSAPKPVEPAAEAPKVAPITAPAAVSAVIPTVVSNAGTSKPEAVAPAHQQVHNLVTQAAPAPQQAKSVEAVEVPKYESTPIPEVEKAEKVPEVEKTVEQPAQKPVNGTAVTPAAKKELESSGTSVSSLAPKNNKSSKPETEQPKLGWFARIFLCKGPGK